MKKIIAVILWLILVPQFVYEMINGSLAGAEILADLVIIILISWFCYWLFNKKNKQDKIEFSEKENLKEKPIFRQTNRKLKNRKSVPWVCSQCGYTNTINEVACEKCNKV
jgi:rubrerythrin